MGRQLLFIQLHKCQFQKILIVEYISKKAMHLVKQRQGQGWVED